MKKKKSCWMNYRRQNFRVFVKLLLGYFHATETLDEHFKGLVDRNEDGEWTCGEKTLLQVT